VTFRTKAHAKDIQIRLYAPKGRVLWDAVRLAKGALKPSSLAGGGPVQVSKTSGTSAAAAMALASSSGRGSDAAGAASNSYKIAEAKALLHYIRRRPIYGYGFGSTATDFSPTGYSYELSYLDLLFKTGILGLLIFLSFPVRLVIDALRLRRRLPQARIDAAGGIGSPGVVVGVIGGILAAGATNPYLFAAFGLISILAMVAWLEPAQRD
jgi:O-antigen ligase